MEWQTVLQFALPYEVLQYRLLSSSFNELVKEKATWCGYIMGAATCCKTIDDFKIADDIGAALRVVGVQCDAELADMKLREAVMGHKKHWGRMYCPMAWGVRAKTAAEQAIQRSGRDASTHWLGLWMAAWNGARSLMKGTGLIRNMFDPFLEYARRLREAPFPSYSALGIFTEGYVFFAMGFSAAGKEEDFHTAYKLQTQGLSLYTTHTPCNEVTVEMQERVARTSVFVADPSLAVSLYEKARDSGSLLWEDPRHPLLQSINYMLKTVLVGR
eukprot:TRINITY_DN2808_c2_g1_i2.p1 TRINITY_DN2808_c2_g1~~TRINITY_DN2808_c2_g1_i2.p1  ORF type:complete len:272 (+),score=45.02 TRINITY_DN2808_c2_g1_i2:42-857(+)